MMSEKSLSILLCFNVECSCMNRIALLLFLLPFAALRAEDALNRNELAAVAACKAFAEAEEIYHRTDFDGDGVLEYAQSLRGGKKSPQIHLDPEKLPKATPDEAAQIGKLIKNLGSNEYSTRETAAKDIADIGAK